MEEKKAAEAKWQQIEADLADDSWKKGFAGSGPDGEQVQAALEGLFDELKKLSESAKAFAGELQKKENQQ